MKIGLITNTLPRYNKNRQNINKNYAQPQSNMSPQNLSSFCGLRTFLAEGLGKSSARLGASAQLEDVALVVAKKKRPSRNPVKRAVEALQEISEGAQNTEFIGKFQSKINQETARFAGLLVSKTGKRVLDGHIGIMNRLMDKYIKYPNARRTMESVASAKYDSKTAAHHINIKEGWERIRLVDLPDIFGKSYKGTDVQNRFIEHTLNAKREDGSRRFPRLFGDWTESLFENYSTPEHEEAVKLLLDATVTSQKVQPSRLSEILKSSSTAEDFENRFKYALDEKTSIFFDNEGMFDIIKPTPTEAFVKIVHGSNNQTLPILKTMLSHANHSVDIIPIAEIMQAASDPKKAQSLANGLALLEKGKLSLSELAEALKIKD